MKTLITAVAFSVSSFVSFGRTVEPTPLTSIPLADKVELLFTAEADTDYLSAVQAALAARDIELRYTRVKYDAAGLLQRIAFELVRPDGKALATSADVSEKAGAYVYLAFGDN